MSKDLMYYRLLPYEREWMMREEAGEKYFVVRLRDLPAVAGDGSSREEAVEDLRAAFDEFVVAWLEAGREVPEPRRGFTLPSAAARRPAKEWPVATSEHGSDYGGTSSWADSAVVYTNNVLVRNSRQKPRLSRDLETAAIS
jgi:predicted RNase H-like HicB family nuclease